MGTFRTTKGAQLIASTNYKVGDEVSCSYGPKSAADYLLEHGFIPDQCWKNAVCEITFEIDPNDRFYDDKLDILEFETYDQAPMDPLQSFDVISTAGRDGEPDPAMIQFLRLSKLGKTDAFLLESIFRKDVWDFMSFPVSEQNEVEVITEIVDVCTTILEGFAAAPGDGPEICTKLRELETTALQRTIAYLEREKQAVDLKEYYQQRRLRDLGLDSQWTPEDDDGDDGLNFGQSRKPGGADYDW
jgi:[ribulose-bisphosphate carboxylase]/[fructose-bisphosphate aldolase]-lysine N-methyltransferase